MSNHARERGSPDKGRVWRRVVPVALLSGLATGCAIRPGDFRAPREAVAVAPDLFDLWGLTPLTPAPRVAIHRPTPAAPGLVPRSNPEVSADHAVAKAATAAETLRPIPVSIAPYPIDLPTALRLADTENPTIAEARVAILVALAEQQIADALLLPSLNAGANYHGHDGNLQRSSGRILRLSEQSFYLGGGTRTLAAESVAIPAVNIFSPLADAIFEPLAARRRVDGARLEAAATANDVLLKVADLYLDLLAAEAELESRRLSAAQADQIVKIIADYASTGQGRKADAARADADRRMLQAEIQRSDEEVAVASARLSNRLNLDPSVALRVLSGSLAPLTLVDADRPTEELLAAALARRPDLGAREALVAMAEVKHKQEKARPLLPTVWLGFSGGALGGGSNLVPPLLGNFAGRTDFDVRAYWTLQNFGVGNLALIKRRGAEVGQAVAERSRVANRVRSEVVSARGEALARGRQVEVARTELASAEDGYREDDAALRESIATHPIEVLDSLKLLAAARLNLIIAITGANQAQFALFVALGSPPPLDASPSAPGTSAAPPPIATPLRSPIRRPKPEPSPLVGPPGPPILGR